MGTEAECAPAVGSGDKQLLVLAQQSLLVELALHHRTSQAAAQDCRDASRPGLAARQLRQLDLERASRRLRQYTARRRQAWKFQIWGVRRHSLARLCKTRGGS